MSIYVDECVQCVFYPCKGTKNQEVCLKILDDDGDGEHRESIVINGASPSSNLN